MLDVEAQLATYGQAVENALTEAADVAHTPARRSDDASGWWGRQRVLVGTAAVVVVLVGWVLLVSGGEQQVSTADGTGVFPRQTDSVLVFTGNNDLVVFDVDSGRAIRHPVDGNRSGDHPFWLAVANNHFVIGWEEIYAAPFDGRSRKIDDATVFFPSSQPGAVWTVDYSGAYPTSDAEVRLVTTTGEVLASFPGFDGERYVPLTGIPGGLAVQDRATGILALWDPETGQVEPLGPEAFIDNEQVVTDGHVIAWCTDGCDDLHVRGLAETGEPPTPSSPLGISRLAIAPDGASIATQTDSRLTVFDRRPDGDYEPAHQFPIEEPGSIHWSPDGRHLFYSTPTDNHPVLGLFDQRTAAWTTVALDDIDFFPAGFVVLDRSQARPLLDN